MRHNQLILGMSRISLLRPRELLTLRSTLLSHPHLSTIQLDTARSYNHSEELISNYFTNIKKSVLVDTKIANTRDKTITRRYLEDEFTASKKALNPLKIQTLFIHSCNPLALTVNACKFLNQLKENGDVKSIGYSGDGQYLKIALQLQIFDVYMATFSIIDQSNYPILSSIKDRLTIKRVMGSGVMRMRQWKRVRRGFGSWIGEDWTREQHSYQFRNEVLVSELGFAPKATDFLQFVDKCFPISQKVISTSSNKHLNQLLDHFDEPINSQFNAKQYIDAWGHCERYEWKVKV